MSFWRDGDFIGTLMRNLPRTGYLYPVVVPFNSGVTFAITGMMVPPSLGKCLREGLTICCIMLHT